MRWAGVALMLSGGLLAVGVTTNHRATEDAETSRRPRTLPKENEKNPSEKDSQDKDSA